MSKEITIGGKTQKIDECLVSVTDLYKMIEPNGKQLYLNRDDGVDIPLDHDEFLLIHGGEQFVIADKELLGKNPALRNDIRPTFNGTRNISLKYAKITGQSLKKHDDKFPNGRLFADCPDTIDHEITNDMKIVVQNEDSYFVIPVPEESDDEYIDLEECGKHDRKPPKHTQYRIRIDGEKHDVDSSVITGAGILQLVGKTVEEWALNQKHYGGQRTKIAADAEVDLACPGIERFETVRMYAQQGQDEEPYFALPEEDRQYLSKTFDSKWRQVEEGNKKWGLLIDEFPIPEGYNVQHSTLMVLIPTGYPGSRLDMFYCHPPLGRPNGTSIQALATEFHFGQDWQRWSRHYDWNPGEDSIARHLEFVKNQLSHELKQ